MGVISSSISAMALDTGVNFLLLAIGFLYVARETGLSVYFTASPLRPWLPEIWYR